MNASYRGKEVTRRVQVFLRLIILGALAGGLAGLVVGGIGGRIAMWAVAVTRGDTPAVHAEATTQMILEVTYRGIGIGILYGLFRRLLAGSTLCRAVMFGAVLVLLMLVFAFATNWRAEFSQSPLVVSLIVFGAVFFTYGAAVEVLMAGLDRVVFPRLPFVLRVPLHFSWQCQP